MVVLWVFFAAAGKQPLAYASSRLWPHLLGLGWLCSLFLSNHIQLGCDNVYVYIQKMFPSLKWSFMACH